MGLCLQQKEGNMKYDIQKIIKKFEPLMHKLLRKYHINGQYYDDFLQELKIRAWTTVLKYDKKKASLSTLMYNSLENRIQALLHITGYLKTGNPCRKCQKKLICSKACIKKEKHLKDYYKKYNVLHPITYEDKLENYHTTGAEKIRINIKVLLIKDRLSKRDGKILDYRIQRYTEKQIGKFIHKSQQFVSQRLKHIQYVYNKIFGGN